MKTRRLLLPITLILLMAVTMGVQLASAANYDGTYTLYYSYYNGSSWQWITLENGLIVSDGETSSPRSGYFLGYVDSDGSVWMQSPNPLAPSETATWTGQINSDGSGGGDWRAPDGYGTWTVERVSGPIGGFESSILLGLYGGLGGGGILYSLGFGQTKKAGFIRGMPGLGAKTPKWSGRMRSKSFWSEPPNPPPPVINQDNLTGVRTRGRPPFIGEPARNQSPPSGLPPFIGMDGGGVAATSGGPRVGGDLFPRLETLFGNRTPNGMEMWWEPPKFNPEAEELVGYRVYGYIWGPNSTQPVEVLLTNPPWPPNISRGFATFDQTYRFSTGGDIEGFRVEPLFRRIAGAYSGRIFPGQASTFLPW
jgi:hypothetical protein